MNKKGFTLIELLIYVGVSTIVLASVTGLMFATLSSYAQARVHQNHQHTLHMVLKTLRNLTETSYAVDPRSDLGIDLATPNTEVVFLGQQTDESVRIYMTNNILYAARGNNQGVALNSIHVPLTSCTVDSYQNTTPLVSISCTVQSDQKFGLPQLTSTLSTTFSLLRYAPQ